MSAAARDLAQLTPAQRDLLLRGVRARRGAAGGAPERIPRRRDPAAPAPLSFAQQRLWFLDRMQPGDATYNIALAIRIAGRLRVDLMRATIEALIRRHESLRTTFQLVDGQAAQVFSPSPGEPLPVVDLRGLEPRARDRVAGEICDAAAARPFDLGRGPLLRPVLLCFAGERHILSLVFHHIVSDLWSFGVFIGEMAAVYAAMAADPAGPGLPLPPLPIQYADYAVWQRDQLRGERLEREIEHWRRELAGVPVSLDLPLDHPRRPALDPGGASLPWSLAADAASRLRQLGEAAGATLFMTVLAAWSVLLARFTGQDDLVVGAPVANRPRVELEGLIGFFVNMLVLRADLTGNPSARQLLLRVKAKCLQALGHQELPFEQLVDHLKLERGLREPPLIQVVLAFQNVALPAVDWPGLRLDPLPQGVHTAKFDLALDVEESGAELLGHIGYRVSLFERSTVERLARCFTVLVAGLVAAPERSVWELPLLAESDRQQVLGQVGSSRPVGVAESLPERAAVLARSTPDAPAAVGPDGEVLSYGELAARASRIAAGLRRLGMGAEARVAVALEPSPERLIAALGVLAAGGACLLLEPGRERAWLEPMLEHAGCTVVLARGEVLGRLQEHGGIEAPYEGLVGAADAGKRAWERVEAAALAFVVETAEPGRRSRLAGIPHASVAAWAAAWRRRWGPAQLGAVAGESAAETCDGVFDLAVPLYLGGCQVSGPFAAAALRSATPSQLAVDLRRGSVGDARALRPHGEVLGASLRARLLAAGAAEVCDSFSSALGGVWPVEDLEAYVLGRQQEPVPVGVTGELWLGGEALARGFEGDAERTAERFVPDPCGAAPGSRRVATGYRGRRRVDGQLEILGGVERQMWLRGLPADLDLIEELLAQHPRVLRAAVGLQGEGAAVRLVAHALGAGPPDPAPAELLAFLRSRLPAALTPTGIAVVAELPLGRTGSVDRDALPWVESDAGASPNGAPLSPAEAMLAGIWSAVIKVEDVGIHDNFFRLGGDSILALEVVVRVREAGWSMTPRQLFAHQTIAGLAKAIAPLPAARGEAEEATGAADRPLPLTPVQRWFFDQDLVRPEHWNQAVLLAAREPLRHQPLARALAAVIAGHGALRLRFRRAAAGWTQAVGAAGPLPLGWIDLSALAPERRRRALEEAAARCQASLDLDGSLVRVALFRLGTGEADRLLWIVHHLAVDAVSWRILLADLERAYRQAAAGQEPRLAPEATSFGRWAERLAAGRREPRLERAAAALAALAASVASTASPVAAGREQEAEQVVASLSEAETRALLRRVQGDDGTRADDLLLTALLAAWRQWTGERALHVDLEGHGREDPLGDADLSRTVGWLTVLTPVLLAPVAVAGEPDVEALLASVQGQLRSLPSGVEIALAGGTLADLPRAPILFNFLGQLDRVLGHDALWEPAAESPGPSRDPGQRRSYPLELNTVIAEGRFQLDLRGGGGKPLQGLADAFLEALRALIGGSRGVEERQPLAPLQSGILFHGLLAPQSGIYVTSLSCVLRGALDQAAFVSAWRRLLERHAALRTRFAWQGLVEPVLIEQDEVDLPLAVEDWSGLATAEQERRAKAGMEEDRRRGFILSQAPLLRLRLVRLGPDSHRFVWHLHHLVSDGWSLAILMGECLALYEAAVRGAEVRLPALRPYRDYARWLAARPPERSRDLWRRRLAGFAEATPLRLGRDPVAAAQEAAPAERSLQLPAAASGALRVLARRCEVSLYMVIAGAFALLLRRLSGRDDVVFGTVVAGRPSTLPGVERMVGCFINTLPMRVSTAANLPLDEWLRGLHSEWLETEEHQHVPLTAVTAWSDLGPGKPLFSSLLVFENYPVRRAVAEWRGSLAIEGLEVGEQTNYPFNLAVVPGEQTLLHSTFDRGSAAPAAVEGALLYLASLLAAMAAEPRTRLQDLPRLTAPERHQLLVERRGAGRLAAVPGAARRAARWAGQLRALGAGPETPTCVLLHGEAALEAARLAVRQAASLCLLLAASHRLEDLVALLHDSGSKILLTDREGARRLRGEVGDLAILEVAAELGTDADAAVAHDAAAAPGAAAGSGAGEDQLDSGVFLLDGASCAGRQVRADVLDAWLTPVPVWGVGELYLGGEGLAGGFWRQPARTAERFVPDPSGEVPGARLFRSGEAVRRLADGTHAAVLAEAPGEALADVPLAPRDETERRLARIWEDLLGTTGIGVRDPFFARGGDSLLAVRLMSRIGQELGAEIPLRALFQAPTIEGLARWIGTHRGTPPDEVLVPLQRQGWMPPLFFVHPVGGAVFCYRDLAGRLGGGQPFYGIQAATVGGGETIEEMASGYLAAVRGSQPVGPYHLGGWSLGGVIAFEMASQLWAAGETVALLALVDAPPARREDRASAPAGGGDAFLYFAADLMGLRGSGASMPGREVVALDADARLRWLHARAQEQGVVAADLDFSWFRGRFEVFRRNACALAGYAPRPVPGSLLFVACEERGGGLDGDPTRGWGRLAAATAAHTVAADHYSILREPHVAALARLLAKALGGTADPAPAAGAVSPAV